MYFIILLTYFITLICVGISLYLVLQNFLKSSLWFLNLLFFVVSSAILYSFFVINLNKEAWLFFNTYRQVFIALHLIGLTIGLGGATASDFLFFRFLKDRKINKFEASVLENMSKLIWAGLFLLFISGFTLFLIDPEQYSNSSKFILKMLVVLVVTINGVFLGRFVTPKLTSVSFNKTLNKKIVKNRRLIIMFGTISACSWYTAFALGNLRSIPLNTTQAILVYLVLLLGAILVVQLIERWIFKK